jgi:hypothetical protein
VCERDIDRIERKREKATGAKRPDMESEGMGRASGLRADLTGVPCS